MPLTMKFNTRIIAEASILLMSVLLSMPAQCQNPPVVNIGAIFTFNSVIGKAAKAAMEIAVSDVNEDPNILNGTQLKIIMEDASCEVFMGSIKAFQVIEKEVLLIIGPQSSAIARIISHIANGLQVPLISYAATDPTLCSLQFPYFLRTTQTDSNQMAAMADLIDFYGWKEVIAIFVDDDYGRNGISALGDALASKMSRIVYKLPLPYKYDVNDIADVLSKSKIFGPRVYVVHINPDSKLKFFSTAQSLGMMGSGYVWFATDWVTSSLDSFRKEKGTSLKVLEGVVTLSPHVPKSSRIKAFANRWRKIQKGVLYPNLHAYALYAYDTVWVAAQAIDEFLKEHGNVKFSYKLQDKTFKVFDDGKILLRILSRTNFTGLTGSVTFDASRNLVSRGYDIINIEQLGIHRVGYWSRGAGFSVTPQESLTGDQIRVSFQQQKLKNITWPGGEVEKPRGWVIATREKPLRIGVPKRFSFTEFVTEENTHHKVQGYCIDLFHAARELVPYDVPYIFEPFGNGLRNPNYNNLVSMVSNDVFDAAIGDIAIVPNRTRRVDFTQPFVATGLVILAPLRESNSSAWVFLKPFTYEMWCATAASFVIIAVVIWMLEHRVNDDFRGPPKRQLATMFLFSFSTLFKANTENTVSALGRVVMVVWLFLLLVITSSYTANLTSILTVQQLSSPITDIDSLIASRWPIGYQAGSFARSYMRDSLFIPQSRLVRLGSPEEYETALRLGPKNGGVAAIVDELPYVELFLLGRADFGIVGQPFTKSGWGFAFKKDSPLCVDMSTAILKLGESGKLQEIHNKWFCKSGCPDQRRKKPKHGQLHLRNFWALYAICALCALSAFLVFLLSTIRQYIRYKKQQIEQAANYPSASISSNAAYFSQVILNFLDFVDEKEESIKHIFTQHDNSQTHQAENNS